jgi:hypothetical protein
LAQKDALCFRSHVHARIICEYCPIRLPDFLKYCSILPLLISFLDLISDTFVDGGVSVSSVCSRQNPFSIVFLG